MSCTCQDMTGKDPVPSLKFPPLPLELPALPPTPGDLSTCHPILLSTCLVLQSSKMTHCTPHPSNHSPGFVLWTLATDLKTTPCPHQFQTKLHVATAALPSPSLPSPYSSYLTLLPGPPSFISFSPGSWSLKPGLLSISMRSLVLCSWSPRGPPPTISPFLESPVCIPDETVSPPSCLPGLCWFLWFSVSSSTSVTVPWVLPSARATSSCFPEFCIFWLHLMASPEYSYELPTSLPYLNVSLSFIS